MDSIERVGFFSKVDIPRCQHVKDTVEVDADGSVVGWIAATVPSVGRVYDIADPGLNVGGGERRGTEGFAGSLCGWDFVYVLCSDVTKVCEAGLERALAGI